MFAHRSYCFVVTPLSSNPARCIKLCRATCDWHPTDVKDVTSVFGVSSKHRFQKCCGRQNIFANQTKKIAPNLVRTGDLKKDCFIHLWSGRLLQSCALPAELWEPILKNFVQGEPIYSSGYGFARYCPLVPHTYSLCCFFPLVGGLWV